MVFVEDSGVLGISSNQSFNSTPKLPYSCTFNQNESRNEVLNSFGNNGIRISSRSISPSDVLSAAQCLCMISEVELEAMQGNLCIDHNQQVSYIITLKDKFKKNECLRPYVTDQSK